MTMDAPMVRSVLQRWERRAKKKADREDYARKFFLILGGLATTALMFGTGAIEGLSWQGMAGLFNAACFALTVYFSGLLLVRIFPGLYRKMEAVDEDRLNALELDALAHELRDYPGCLQWLLEERGRSESVSLTRVVQALVDAGVHKV